ncbi:non-ribosomal peptide synthetase [Lysobacter fragariae]
MTQNPPSGSGTDSMSQRLARLSPQQRELLLRGLAARNAGKDTVQRCTQAGVPYPLSAPQQRMWFFERLQPGTAAYHVFAYFRLDGALDAQALQDALTKVVQRHDALRTSFDEVAGEARQTVAATVAFQLARIDLSQLPAAEREAQAQRECDIETDCPFDLARAPLLRATLLRLSDDQHILLIVMHHIVSDAWSIGVLLEEVAQLYNASVDATPVALAEPAVQFGDAVLWQTSPAHARKVEAQQAFWQEALAGTTGLLDLPTDRPRSPVPLGRGERFVVQLPQALVDDISELARREGATLFMALLAAFQTLLGRLSGQDDVVVGTPVANRRRTEFESVVGLFVNTLAMRGDLGGDPSFRHLLARTRTHCLDALEQSEAPLERVIDSLRIERAPGRTPLFQTMFVLQNTHNAPLALRGITAKAMMPPMRAARFDLTLALEEDAGHGLDGVIDFDADLFETATIERLARQYEMLLRGAIAHPDLPLSRIALLSDEDRAQLLALGDGGTVAFADADPAAQPTLFAMFAAQARLTPHAVALVEPGRELTYQELLHRAYGVAHALRAHNIGVESCVGVLTDRSIEALVSVLGVLAAGAAYVPLDPAHPDERLHFLLADCASQALLAPPVWFERARTLGSRTPLLRSDAEPRTDAPRVDVDARDCAYVIYTSGSTGNPKGVAIEHRGAVNLVRGFIARHDFRGQRLLMIPPLVFDASVGDVFPVLATGATLVLHPTPTELGPFELERFCDAHAISAIDAPAALWRRWSEGWIAAARSEPLLPQLRLMMIGGESVPVELVRRFAIATQSRVVLTNHYGPTEASVCATILATRDGSELNTLDLPIGTPLPGVRVYILDAHLGLAPRGVVGELCIAGAGIAREYLGLSQLSADSFLPDPFAVEPDSRMYRTGDLARWNSDGTLQFLGRRDHQVKLRGVRIELGEIETALQAHPQVQAAAALLREDRPGDKRLVGYFVADSAELTPSQLREHLAQRLPEALLPSVFVRLDAMPLTRNGKVDRRALPEPAAAQDVARELRAASTPTEHAVIAVWREVLGREDIGADDDFFAIGGDSLMTLPLVFKLHAALGVEVPLPAVFATPTVAGLSRTIDALRAGDSGDVLDLRTKVVLDAAIDPRNTPQPAAARGNPRSVLITGATGFLGAYIARELLDTTQAELLCLVRADTVADGLRRVRANLESYGLWRDGDETRLVPLPGDLSQPLLGLGDDGFTTLAQRADLIFHNGGQVNFLAPYEHMEAANVQGTVEVLRLATHTLVKPVHLVSTLGVYATEHYVGKTVLESDPAPLPDGQSGGYNQSKWVGEQLALVARERGLPVAIYRPARITGDSRTGAGNVGDYFNAWIRGCVQLGMAPHLPRDAFDMAPVDYVGRAIVRIALGAGDANGNFHFFNPHRLSLPDAIVAIRAAGHALDEVPYEQWREALVATSSTSRENALTPFAGMFPAQEWDPAEPAFDCSASRDAVEPLGLTCPPADQSLFSLYLRYLHERGALPTPAAAAAMEVLA